MTKIELLEMIKVMIDTKEIDLCESDRKDSLNTISDIEKCLMEYYKDYIIKEIQTKDCCNAYEDYDSWYSFFGDSDGSEIEGYMRELFTEEECEKLWQDSHMINKECV